MTANPTSAQSGHIILETERLLVKELVHDDASFILDLLTQPSFLEFIGDRGVHDDKTAQEYISLQQSQYLDPRFGSYGVP